MHGPPTVHRGWYRLVVQVSLQPPTSSPEFLSREVRHPPQAPPQPSTSRAEVSTLARLLRRDQVRDGHSWSGQSRLSRWLTPKSGLPVQTGGGDGADHLRPSNWEFWGIGYIYERWKKVESGDRGRFPRAEHGWTHGREALHGTLHRSGCSLGSGRRCTAWSTGARSSSLAVAGATDRMQLPMNEAGPRELRWIYRALYIKRLRMKDGTQPKMEMGVENERYTGVEDFGTNFWR